MTTKINLNNIDTSTDLSVLVPSAYQQANAAFTAANTATTTSTSAFNPFLLSGM
jgi:hypothetical protein